MVTVTAQLGNRATSFEYDATGDFATLVAILTYQLGLEDDVAATAAAASRQLLVRYRDADGDVITVGTTEELQLAMTNVQALALQVALPAAASTATAVPSPAAAAAAAAPAPAPTAAAAAPAPEAPAGSAAPAAMPSAADDMQYVLNEFQYHRLLIQTGIENAFSKFVKTAFAPQPEPAAATDSFAAKARDGATIVHDVVVHTFEQMKAHFASLPPPSEIANSVMQQLRTLGVYAAAALEELRADIMAALERLYATVSVRQITYGEAEAAVQQAVERPADAASSSSAAAPAAQNSAHMDTQAAEAEASAAPIAVTVETVAAETSMVDPAAATEMAVDAPSAAFESQPSLLDAASSGNATTDALTTPRSVAYDVTFDELNDSIMPMAAPSAVAAVAAPEPAPVPAPAAASAEAAVPATSASLQTSVDSMDLVDTDDFVVVGVAPSATAPAPTDVAPMAEAPAMLAPALDTVTTERGPAVVPVPVAMAAAPEPAAAPTAAASPLRLSGSLILPSVRPRTATDATQPAGVVSTGPYASQVAVLREMGFPHGTDVLVALLEQVHGNIDAVIDRL